MSDEIEGVGEPPGGSRAIWHDTGLGVWRVAMDVADVISHATAGFPKREVVGRSAQLRRAAVSIPSAIAEGWSRGRSKESAPFLRIAARRGYVTEAQLRATLAQTDSISRVLNRLLQTLG